jgi:DDE superfamily endonuclease
MPYCPRSSLPAQVLLWLANHLAPHLPPRPARPRGRPPLPLEIRLDAVGAVLLDGLSYRRAARMVGIGKTAVGDSLDLLLGKLAELGICQPDGTFITNLDDLATHLAEMTTAGEAVVVDGLATRVQRPASWTNQKVLYDAKRRAHTAQGLVVTTIAGDLLWCDGGWPGSAQEHELLGLSGIQAVLETTGVTVLLDRGFRALTRPRAAWWDPIGNRQARHQRTEAERAYNRTHASLRALVEHAIGHLANGWALRRWRGLLWRTRQVFRATAALVSLGRWLHRIPT